MHRLIKSVGLMGIAAATITAADVTSFTLINADTDQPITGYDPIGNNATLDLSVLPTSALNIRANVNGSVGSVQFVWSGAESGTQTESAAPYAMKGDSSGNYNAWTPSAGNYSLTGTPYVGSGASGGTAGAVKTISFSVTAGSPPPLPPPTGQDGDGSVTIAGELRMWHRVDVNILAKYSDEMATPNPFLDYRYNVTFTAPSGKTLVVPGYFNTDGAGGDSGNVWTAHLNPNESGTWNYVVSFRSGTNVAVNLGTTAGTVVSPFNNKSGSFVIANSNKSGVDFRAVDKGMLINRNQHYLTYEASGKPFLWTGPGIPENILGYRGFTNTTVGIGHQFTVHEQHWKSGDPDWDNGKGKALIGALNYIADNGGNTLYMMSTTIGGDGKDCFPHPTTGTTKNRYDLLKLLQWEIALAHAQKKGIYLHWVLAENEVANYTYYGGTNTSGSLTNERKLYFRMMNARFGYFNALKWNLCEENEWVKTEREVQAAYLKAIDPYDHPVTFQTGGAGLPHSEFDKHFGNNDFDSTSFQGSNSNAAMFDQIKKYRDNSAATGVKVTSAWDEPQKIENNMLDSVGYPVGRRDKMWPCLMAGGDGFLWYIQADGGGHGFDQRIEDFTIMQASFKWSGYIRDFLLPLPLLDMQSSMDIVTSTTGQDYTIYKDGEVYAIFNDRAGTGMSINLSGKSGTFTVQWFDPRNGGALQNGTVTSISGGGTRNLGNAPNSTNQDWAVLVSKTGGTTNTPPSVSLTSPTAHEQFTSPASIRIIANATDSDGTIAKVEFIANGTLISTENLAPYDWTWTNVPVGTYAIVAKAYDDDGATTTSAPVQVTVSDPTTSYIPGLAAEFFDFTTALSVIPNMSGLTPDVVRTDAQINYPSVSSAWVGLPSTMSDTFSSRHTGLLKIDTAGSYTLFIKSDDGSKLYLNGSEVINNDGTHGMRELSYTVTLAAGYYPLAVEFFENGGGAGLIMSWSGPSISKQIIPASALWHQDTTGTGLPAPWISTDVGNVGIAGDASGNGSAFTLSGSGADIWGTADGFQFVHRPLTTDGELIARVVSVENTNAWAKAGVMVRADTSANSAHAMMVITPSKGASFQNRLATGATSNHSTTAGITAPQWVRIVRIGNTVSGYISTDGLAWTQIGSQVTVPVGATPRIGLVVTSHDNSVSCAAEFAEVVFIQYVGG